MPPRKVMMRELLYLATFSAVLSGYAFPSSYHGDTSHHDHISSEAVRSSSSDEAYSGTNLGDGNFVEADDSYADEFPAVTVVPPEGFYDAGQAYVPGPNLTDCSVVEGNSFRYLCDRPNWRGSLGRVPRDQFPDRLEYLGLNDTGLAFYPAASFANKTILFLELNNHRSSSFSLDLDAFQGLSGTQVLHIQGNAWDEPVQDHIHPFFYQFRHLVELTQLKVEMNSLSLQGIDPQMSHLTGEPILPRLGFLSLKGNMVERIEDFFFYPLRESPITELNLNSAGVQSIGPRAFEFLPHLKHVDFFNNPLTVFDARGRLPISVLPSLSRALPPLLNGTFVNLGLAGLGLKTVPTRALAAVRDDLVRLNMARNNLTNLGTRAASIGAFEAESFPRMERLEELILAQSGIEDMTDEPIFGNLPNLKKLDISGNLIKGVMSGILAPSLVDLDMSSQCSGVEQFMDVCKEEFTIQWHIFQNMTELRRLNLGNVLLQSVQAEMFVGLERLEELYLDHTNLLKIQDGAFSSMRKLRRLYLNNNENLVGLNQDTFVALNELEILDLAFSSKAFSMLVEKLIGVVYEGNHSSTTVDASDRAMRPSYETTTMTSTSSSTSTTSARDPSTFPIQSLQSLKELNLRQTQSKHCADSNDCWDASMLQSLPSLEFLDLSDNFLESWENDFFSTNTPVLRTLYLRGNDIAFLHDGMLDTFRMLGELDLYDNKISCSDGVVDFHDMTLERGDDFRVVDYQDGEGYFCLKEGAQISFKDYYDSRKREDTKKLLWGMLAGVLFVLLVVVAYVVYRNRYFLSYRMLSRRRRFSRGQIARRGAGGEKDFDYDVFVCYSKEERRWVLEEFLPALESPDGARGPPIRACVHERDFEVGLTVTDNIVHCLDRSRRFLMVLSSGFASSQWCMFEVQLAQHRLFAEDKNSFLVVLKEQPAKRNKTLSYILANWTYLKWPGGNQDSEGDRAGGGEKRETFYLKLRNSILRSDGDDRLRY